MFLQSDGRGLRSIRYGRQHNRGPQEKARHARAVFSQNLLAYQSGVLRMDRHLVAHGRAVGAC